LKIRSFVLDAKVAEVSAS